MVLVAFLLLSLITCDSAFSFNFWSSEHRALVRSHEFKRAETDVENLHTISPGKTDPAGSLAVQGQDKYDSSKFQQVADPETSALGKTEPVDSHAAQGQHTEDHWSFGQVAGASGLGEN